jgi:hypothetical protein
MLGPNVPNNSAVCHATNMQLPADADSCRASAMSDHFTQHTPDQTNDHKPCELNKSQNHARLIDLASPIQPSHANHCHAANQVRDKRALNKTMSDKTRSLNTVQTRTTTYAPDSCPEQPLSTSVQGTNTISTYQHLPCQPSDDPLDQRRAPVHCPAPNYQTVAVVAHRA